MGDTTGNAVIELDGVRKIDVVEAEEKVVEVLLIAPGLEVCLDLDGLSSWSEVESQASSSNSSVHPQSPDPESDAEDVFLTLKWLLCIGNRCGRAGGAVISKVHTALRVKVR